MKSIVITKHAVERFAERHVGAEVSEDELLAELQAAVQNAAVLRQRTFSGEHIWHAPTRFGRVEVVTKYDSAAKAYVAVTVLPKPQDQKAAEERLALETRASKNVSAIVRADQLEARVRKLEKALLAIRSKVEQATGLSPKLKHDICCVIGSVLPNEDNQP